MYRKKNRQVQVEEITISLEKLVPEIVFVQYLFRIRSMRQTIREIEVNVAYRWFIGYSLTKPILPTFPLLGKIMYDALLEQIFLSEYSKGYWRKHKSRAM